MALFREGYFIVQGLSSQLVGHALSPRPGSMVLDLCAAPGGKSTHLAALMNNQGSIDAFDLHPHKVELIKDNAQRLGMKCITAHAADSRCLPERYQQTADYVLLDAPCSGLGVLASRSDSRFRKEITNIEELAKLSYQLLEAAATYVKPGGKLCYSTCTITNEENSANIRRFLAEHNDFALAPLQGLIPLLPEKKEHLASGEIQLMPFEADKELEGFYIALLEKRR
ncbi:MAG: methyltransferase domain-containing protein [Firmicutes bacterium]|nr:methyltransferase domain-containing protein [Bacillota bacterium]